MLQSELAMDVLGSVLKAIELLFGRSDASHAQIADFLDTIASDASELAHVWHEALALFDSGRDDADRLVSKYDLKAFGPDQGYGYSRLEAFYRSFTTVVGARLTAERQDHFIMALGSLLQARRLARVEVERAIARTSGSALLSLDGELQDVHDLRTAVDQLQREAATLSVLAKSYRASM
jgi:hypothetical protein